MISAIVTWIEFMADRNQVFYLVSFHFMCARLPVYHIRLHPQGLLQKQEPCSRTSQPSELWAG